MNDQISPSKFLLREPAENEIRARAYHLWLADGQPSGRDLDHWLAAREALLIETAEKTAARPAPAARRVHPPATVSDENQSRQLREPSAPGHDFRPAVAASGTMQRLRARHPSYRNAGAEGVNPKSQRTPRRQIEATPG